MPLSTWREENNRCAIDRGLVDKRQQEYRQLFDSVMINVPSLLIMDPVPVFCNEARCSMKQSSTYFYRDDDHLNLAGAYLFSKKIVTQLF